MATESGPTVFVVAKLEHKLVAHLSLLINVEAFLLRCCGKAVVKQAWSDDMERREVLSTFDQFRQDFRDFDEASRPAM